MNAQTDNHSRKDSVVTVVALLIFLLGTATGNALMMVVVCTVGLAGLLIFDRQRWEGTTWLIMMFSAAIAAVTAIVFTIID